MRLRSSIALLFASTYGPTLVSIQLVLCTLSSALADHSLSSIESETSASGSPYSNPKERRLQSVAVVGDNGSPSSRFPLGLCQGDCDRDSDCAGTLRCFQRNGGQDVPGCSGGSNEGSRSDFCYDPAPDASKPAPTPTLPDPAPVPTPAAGPVVSPVPAPVAAPSPSGPRPVVTVVGDNGSPSSRFPLGLCQGDCDRDSDCAGTLRCFQRNGGQDVPGCSGGSNEGSRSDFCYDPAPEASKPIPVPTRPNPAPVASPTARPVAPPDSTTPVPPPSMSPVAPSGSITLDTFIFKLYWEEGYYWQEESYERRWCIKCRNGCNRGHKMKIVNCDNDGGRGLPDRFRFLPQTSEQVQIQEVASGLCMQLAPSRQITLEVCQAGASDQRFFARVGDLTFMDKFELSPINRPTFCVTQRHHPKDAEIIELEPCDTVAERSDTSFWNLLP
jgi:hypothetical protein